MNKNPGGEWICAFENAADLGAGQIREWSQNGLDLIVWRSQSGKICAMDARCPHQWSHLGSEGAVIGEQIVCCSHFWSFELDGSGWKENERGRRDRKSDIATYPCQEKDGSIFLKIARLRL